MDRSLHTEETRCAAPRKGNTRPWVEPVSAVALRARIPGVPGSLSLSTQPDTLFTHTLARTRALAASASSARCTKFIDPGVTMTQRDPHSFTEWRTSRHSSVLQTAAVRNKLTFCVLLPRIRVVTCRNTTAFCKRYCKCDACQCETIRTSYIQLCNELQSQIIAVNIILYVCLLS